MLLGLGFALGRGQKTPDKLAPYECGFEAFEDSRMRFDVRYYLVAILFIIFDLEIAFLFPWAVSLDEIGLFACIVLLHTAWGSVVGAPPYPGRAQRAPSWPRDIAQFGQSSRLGPAPRSPGPGDEKTLFG